MTVSSPTVKETVSIVKYIAGINALLVLVLGLRAEFVIVYDVATLL